jgi:hypothetical protein
MPSALTANDASTLTPNDGQQMTMRAELRDEIADNELLHPAYWLVLALPWPGGSVAEAVLAIAPGMIPREPGDVLGDDAFQILAMADRYAGGRRKSVIFFSELTRTLTRAGTTWANHGIDWQSGLAELEHGEFPGLYMAISERAYMVICDPQVSTTQAFERDRDLVRASIAGKLGEDWPPFMCGVIDAAQAGMTG